MQITKEMLAAKLQALNKQEEQLLADLNAVAGARQTCLQLIETLEAVDEEEKKS